jgi:hypothetical protein
MKRTMVVLVSLLLAASPVLQAAAPEFNLQEPISLDLRDASITEVITLLGSLANLPVLIGPDVSGALTVQVQNVPFARVLEIIGSQNGIWLRVEGGKLVASSRARRLTGNAPAAASPAFDRQPSGPRLPVDDYSRGFASLPPLYFRARGNGAEACSRIAFENGSTYRIPIPGSDSEFLATQFGWEPVTRTRFVAVEAPDLTSRAFGLAETGGMSAEVKRAEGSLGWAILPRVQDAESCAEPAAFRHGAGRVTLRLEIRERREDGMTVLFAPQITTWPGTVFSTRGGLRGETGQHREVVIYGYVSADGKSAAATLVATAIWTDPKEEREYVYAQLLPVKEIPFTALTREGLLVSTLPAGAALERPLDLSIWLAPEKSNAAD